jgi:TPR repeat protein
MMCFASCGKAEVDDVKLKACAWLSVLVVALTLTVRKIIVCSTKRHARKRAAEIRDDRLFRQPDESHLGECPICCLPLPLKPKKGTFRMSCCCKRMCTGCVYANKKRAWEQRLVHKCAYCREPVPKTQEEIDQNYMKRVKANDPDAISVMGDKCYHKGDSEGAVQYWSNAAELGEMDAHHNLSCMYRLGEGVERDAKKEVYHLEEAAIGGHPVSRHNLGCYEEENGNIERAVKHFIIAAKLGYDDALEAVKDCFSDGFVNKEDFEAALRGHQAAVDATKSELRDASYKYYRRRN